jgi:hypothetical protein
MVSRLADLVEDLDTSGSRTGDSAWAIWALSGLVVFATKLNASTHGGLQGSVSCGDASFTEVAPKAKPIVVNRDVFEVLLRNLVDTSGEAKETPR